MTPADELAYSQLISDLADRLPHDCVNPQADDIPKLTNKDLALIYKAEGPDVAHYLDLDIGRDAALMADADFCAAGVNYGIALERACREAICYALVCEIEARERDEQIERAEYEWVRGPLEPAI